MHSVRFLVIKPFGCCCRPAAYRQLATLAELHAAFIWRIVTSLKRGLHAAWGTCSFYLQVQSARCTTSDCALSQGPCKANLPDLLLFDLHLPNPNMPVQIDTCGRHVGGRLSRAHSLQPQPSQPALWPCDIRPTCWHALVRARPVRKSTSLTLSLAWLVNDPNTQLTAAHWPTQ